MCEEEKFSQCLLFNQLSETMKKKISFKKDEKYVAHKLISLQTRLFPECFARGSWRCWVALKGNDGFELLMRWGVNHIDCYNLKIEKKTYKVQIYVA